MIWYSFQSVLSLSPAKIARTIKRIKAGRYSGDAPPSGKCCGESSRPMGVSGITDQGFAFGFDTPYLLRGCSFSACLQKTKKPRQSRGL